MTHNTYPGAAEAAILDPMRDEDSGYPHATDPVSVSKLLGMLGTVQQLPPEELLPMPPAAEVAQLQ